MTINKNVPEKNFARTILLKEKLYKNNNNNRMNVQKKSDIPFATKKNYFSL